MEYVCRANHNPRRFHSEPRRAYGNQGNHSTSFPTPPQNGHLVSDGNHANRAYAGYRQPRADERRLQSLPPTKPNADEFDPRQVRSAPNNEAVKAQGSTSPLRGHKGEVRRYVQPRSKVNDIESAMDFHRKTQGKTTTYYEDRYLRSNKFGTSWAQVRADNPTFHEMSPKHSPSRPIKVSHHSPDSGTRADSTRDSSPSTHNEVKKEHIKSHHKSHRGRSHHKTRTGAKSRRADETNNGDSPGRQYVSGEDGTDGFQDSETGSPAAGDARERKISKKKEWNDCVVVPPYQQPPPKHTSLRYLDSLTFKPAINTGKEVYKTYVGQDNKPVRESNVERTMILSENEEGYDSSSSNDDSTSGSDEGSDGGSRERPRKERFLNKREAIKYIKMTNVYGSDAFKNQRKEWFVQKFSEVQEKKAKYEADLKREEKKKRQEDMKRQRRQLNYVRAKFRNEQEQRFRTQYVTARVLEHEQANRHVYGLPEDFLDLANELHRANEDDSGDDEKDRQENKENRLSGDNVNNKNQKSVTDSSPVRNGGGKKSNVSPERDNVKKKKDPNIKKKEAEIAKQKKKEEEALAKARENQKGWYTKPEIGQQSVSPSTETRSHGSHATSGYESDKADRYETVIHTDKRGKAQDNTINDRNKNNLQSMQLSDDRQKERPTGQNRLESQKNIYTRENPVKTKPRIGQQVLQGAPHDHAASKPNTTNKKQTHNRTTQPHASTGDRPITDHNKPENTSSSPDKINSKLDNRVVMDPNAVKNSNISSAAQNSNSTPQNRIRDSKQSSITNDKENVSVNKNENNRTQPKPEPIDSTHKHTKNNPVFDSSSNVSNVKSDEMPNHSKSTTKDGRVNLRNADDARTTPKNPSSTKTGNADLSRIPNNKIGAKSIISKSQHKDEKNPSDTDSFSKRGNNREDQNATVLNSSRQTEKQQGVVLQNKQPQQSPASGENKIIEKRLPNSKTETASLTSKQQGNVKQEQEQPLPHRPQGTSSVGTSKPSHTQGTSSVGTSKPSHTQGTSSVGTSKPSHTQGTSSVGTSKPSRTSSSGQPNQTTVQPTDTSVIGQTKNKTPDIPTSRTSPHKDTSSPSRRPEHQQTDRSKTRQQSTDVAKAKTSVVSTHQDPRNHGQSAGSKGRHPAKKKESVADRMFNMKAGPTWAPNQKTPKMEGIDTVVVTSKDKKGRDVKKKKNVKDVVKEADKMLKVPTDDAFDKRLNAKQKRSRAPSPDVTLGSDFDVDEDDELDGDIFERLRRKYNIQIDSDEENL